MRKIKNGKIDISKKSAKKKGGIPCLAIYLKIRGCYMLY